MRFEKIVLLTGLLCMSTAQAQSQIPTAGALVVVSAHGEVSSPNDEATITFGVDERDAKKAAAMLRANQKMKQGLDIVRQQDPSAKLKTEGYNSFAVYREEKRDYVGERVIVGWRVRQTLAVTTKNLAVLPKMTAAVQGVLAVDRLNFHVSSEVAKKLDDQRIAATYRNLNERIASIARSMGRQVSDTVLETVDFDPAGNYERVEITGSRIDPRDLGEEREPSFEPGETTLQMKLVGKVRFK